MPRLAPTLDRRGFSLPLVIILMVLLALAIGTGFMRVSEERRIVGDQQAQVDAFAVAQSGLEMYFAWEDSVPVSGDSVAFRVGNRDTAWVLARQVRQKVGNDPPLFVIRSRGISRGSVAYDAATPAAQRTLAQYAAWQSSMSVHAAWTALAGLRSIGGQGIVSGFDSCNVAPAVAGIAIPDSLDPPAAFIDGFNAPPNPVGSMPVLRLGGSGSHNAQAAAMVLIAWDSIINGSVLGTPDATPATPGAWPLDVPGVWRVIRVNGSMTIDSMQSGRGLIVVRDSLVIRSGFRWEGVILVGRQLIVKGNSPPATVLGAIISGLDIKLIPGPPYFTESDMGATAGDQIRLYYHSCNVERALERYGRLMPVANAWIDNWPDN